MSRLPPVEKLPLAVRKNVRDEWEAKKPELEKKISDILGVAWTIDINPNQIYAYADDGYAKESPGAMLASYISGAEWQLKYFVEKHGDAGKNEINTLCNAHTIGMDIDLNKKVSYCGCEVSPSGQLIILFAEGKLGTNIDHAFNLENLTKAFDGAPSAGPLPYTFTARTSIRTQYDAEIDKVRNKVSSALQRDSLTLDPNFDAVYAKLKGAADADDNWQENLGSYTKGYFSAFADWLDSQKVASDEMIREALNEGIESGKVVFRVVDGEKMKSSYNEAVIEDGVLYLQTVPKYFGTNIHYMAEKLMDQL